MRDYRDHESSFIIDGVPGNMHLAPLIKWNTSILTSRDQIPGLRLPHIDLTTGIQDSVIHHGLSQ